MVCEWVAPLADFLFFCLVSILVPKVRRFFWSGGLVHYKLSPVALGTRMARHLIPPIFKKGHVTKP